MKNTALFDESHIFQHFVFVSHSYSSCFSTMDRDTHTHTQHQIGRFLSRLSDPYELLNSLNLTERCYSVLSPLARDKLGYPLWRRGRDNKLPAAAYGSNIYSDSSIRRIPGTDNQGSCRIILGQLASAITTALLTLHTAVLLLYA